MKNKNYGWAGKILRVDLSRGKIIHEETEQYTKFLGGRGINSWILYDKTKPGLDAFNPENPLIFGTGLLVGTITPSSSRCTVTAINPLTGGYGSSNFGGHFSAELKFAGYDHIIFEGRAEKLVYLSIDDKKVELKDARKLVDLTTHLTDKIIKEELGDPDIQTACIGPAGERLVRFASVHGTGGIRAAGRCGMGAVMGSKNLKAVAVRGTGSIEVAQPEKFIEIIDKVYDSLKEDQTMKNLGNFASTYIIDIFNRTGKLSVRNFQGNSYEGIENLKSNAWLPYFKHNAACFSCPVHCDKYVKIDKGKPYADTWTYDIQVTPSSNFARLYIDDINTVIYLQWLTNTYGLDIHSSTDTIQWAIECYERGILKKNDTDGLELKWGNPDLLIELLKRIAYRKEKLGNLLAEGCARAARMTGRGSENYAMHIKGMEIDDEIRIAKGWGLGIITSTRGPGHLDGAITYETKNLPKDLVIKLYGSLGAINPDNYEDKPKLVVELEKIRVIQDCLQICAFVSQWYSPALTTSYGIDQYKELITAVTGWEISKEELYNISERTLCIERAINARFGLNRKDDHPPQRLYEPLPEGPAKGKTYDKEKHEKMLDEYYRLHGWDEKTGLPTKKRLEALGLTKVGEELEELKKSKM